MFTLLSGVAFFVVNSHATQQANRSAALAQQATALTRYANEVSYWLTGSGNNEQIEISNLSDQTITNVMVVAESLTAEPQLPTGTVGVVELGDIPPCSIMTADALNAARIIMVRSPYPSGFGWVEPDFDQFETSGPDSSTKAPRTLSAAQAERRVITFERRNGFKVKFDFLLFTDVNGQTWGRNDQDMLVDSASLAAMYVTPIQEYSNLSADAIDSATKIKYIDDGCS